MPDAATQVQGMVSQDKAQGLFLVSQLAMPDYTLPGALRVPGLEPQARYQVRLVDHPNIQLTGAGGHTMRQLPGWMNEPVSATGEWLAQAGLQLPVLDPETAILIAFERV